MHSVYQVKFLMQAQYSRDAKFVKAASHLMGKVGDLILRGATPSAIAGCTKTYFASSFIRTGCDGADAPIMDSDCIAKWSVEYSAQVRSAAKAKCSIELSPG
eukprot:2252645-Amphidinium_carterae.1